MFQPVIKNCFHCNKLSTKCDRINDDDDDDDDDDK